MIPSERDMVRLNNVHPDLRRVFLLAASRVAMCVIQGVRTREECMVNWGKGRTPAQLKAKGIPSEYAQPKLAKVTWLNNPFSSKHCVQPDSRYGEALDVGPVPLDWNNIAAFKANAAVMLAAADELNVRIAWGGHWKSPDFPHFELVQ